VLVVGVVLAVEVVVVTTGASGASTSAAAGSVIPCPKFADSAEKSDPLIDDPNKKFPWSQFVYPSPKLPARMLKSDPFAVPSRFASPSRVYFTSICPDDKPLTIPSVPSENPSP
jgi:hypothetical protein